MVERTLNEVCETRKGEFSKEFIPRLTTTIKNGVGTSLHSSKKTVKEIAVETGKPLQFWYNAANPNSDLKLSFINAISLARATSDPSLLRLFAEQIGHTVFKLPDHFAPGDFFEMADAVFCTSEMLQKSLRLAVFEKKIDGKNLIKELDWVVAAAARLKTALEQEKNVLEK